MKKSWLIAWWSVMALGLAAAWDMQLEVRLPFEGKQATVPWTGADFSTALPELELVVAGTSADETGGMIGKVTVTDTAGRDRAVEVTLAVLLPGRQWRWYYDPNASTLCAPGRYYFEIDYPPAHTAPPGRFVSYHPEYKVDSLGIDGERSVSIYPYSCVTETATGAAYSLGFPQSEPRVYRIGFEALPDGAGKLSLAVELGLSTVTANFPSQANFSFFLEKLPDGSDFRRAIAAYYRRYPEAIRPRTAHTGGWTLWMTDQVFAPWDFAIGWNQVDTGTPVLQADGTPVRWQQPTYLYTEPWGYYQLFPIKKGYDSHPVTTAEMKQEVAESLGADPDAPDFYVGHVRRRTIAEAVQASACEVDPQGNWQSNYWAGFGMRGVTDAAWILEHFGSLHYSMILCNPDPKQPAPNRGLQSLDVELAELAQPEFAGVQLDSFSAYAGMLTDDFKREHWRTATIPLVISHRFRQPAQLHFFAALEYLKELRRRFPDKLIGANTWLPWTTFAAPYVDAIGAGENSILANENRWFLNLRALAPAKMISVLDYSILTAPETGMEYEKLMRPRFEAGLLYAVYPGTGDGWHLPEQVERARPLYREYMPLYLALAQAPWNPVTGVATPDERVFVERFGDLITVYNAGATRPVTLKSEDGGLTQVYDLRSLETLPAPGGVWTREIPEGVCRIYFTGDAAGWERLLESLGERNREALRRLATADGTPEQKKAAREYYESELRRLSGASVTAEGKGGRK